MKTMNTCSMNCSKYLKCNWRDVSCCQCMHAGNSKCLYSNGKPCNPRFSYYILKRFHSCSCGQSVSHSDVSWKSLYAPYMQTGIAEVELHSFGTSAVDVGKWSSSRPGLFNAGGKSPQYLLNRKLGGPKSWSPHFGEEKIRLCLSQFEPQFV